MRAITVLTLLALSLPAQQTFVVDASNGPGAHFTDLPPALAAANDGDTVVVRAGTYSRASTTRGIRLLGEPGATIHAEAVSPEPALTVSGLPSGREFVMQGFKIRIDDYANNLLALRGCLGRVRLDRLSGDQPSNKLFPAPLVYAENVADLTMAGCSLRGAVPLELKSSRAY